MELVINFMVPLVAATFIYFISKYPNEVVLSWPKFSSNHFNMKLIYEFVTYVLAFKFRKQANVSIMLMGILLNILLYVRTLMLFN
jgi:hypothetical protein